MPGKVCKDIFCRQSGNAWSATACPSTSPPPMKKNKTDQHKSPCKLTACKGFSFSHYSHHTTSQQAAHHQQHRAAAHQPAPHTTTPAPATNTTSQHTAHAQTPHPRRNTSGQPAARQAAAPRITSGTPAPPAQLLNARALYRPRGNY